MAGLYIHIPYCHAKCSYCDFFSTPRADSVDDYVDALLVELSLRRSEIADAFTTVYIGGGTPSILSAAQLTRLVGGISAMVDIPSIVEFTIEANPEDVTTRWCETIKRLGINRVSMGVQSFDNEQLAIINRRHSSQDAVDAIETLRSSGISEISCDLIYGLPGQTLDSWKRSLCKLLDYELPHFSSYLLSYEPGTRLFQQLKHGKVEEASEELAQEMYGYLIEEAARRGYNHYEISNFSKPGHNAVHNSNYWRDLPYLGLGVSAHSFDGCVRRFNANKINDYIKCMSQRMLYCEVDEETADERHNDYIIVALRTAQGIDLKRYMAEWGTDRCNNILSVAKPFIDRHQMTLNGDYLAIAEEHMLISDRIMVEFIV